MAKYLYKVYLTGGQVIEVKADACTSNYLTDLNTTQFSFTNVEKGAESILYLEGTHVSAVTGKEL